MARMLQGQDLLDRAEELGVSRRELSGGNVYDGEPELQRRVIEAERHKRESRIWWIALVSAVASVISAAAAWTAVAVNR